VKTVWLIRAKLEKTPALRLNVQLRTTLNWILLSQEARR
jgi:hypothetical protein